MLVIVFQPLGQYFCFLSHPIQHPMIPGGHPKSMQTSYQHPTVIWVVANIPSTSLSQRLKKNAKKYNLLDDFGATQKPPTSYQLGCNILFFMSLPGSKRTLCLTLASISCFRVTLRSSRQKKHITSSSQLLRSQCRCLNPRLCS